MVCVYWSSPTTTYPGLFLYINGIQISSDTAFPNGDVCVVVPAGSTYKAVKDANVVSLQWIELR